MVIPIVYRSGQSRPVSSFDWFDLATGAGYKRFYAVKGADSTGAIYFLTSEPMDGSSTTAVALVGIVAGNTTVTVNCDITFSNPVYVQAADAYCNFTVRSNSSCSTAVTVYHVSAAAVETSLGTTTTDTRTGGIVFYREAIKIALTAKNFGVGEKLRVKIAFTDSDANDSYLYMDGGSLATATDWCGRTIGTDFTIDIPFRVQT